MVMGASPKAVHCERLITSGDDTTEFAKAKAEVRGSSLPELTLVYQCQPKLTL